MARTDLWNGESQRAMPVWLPVAVAVLIVARVVSSRYAVKSPVDLVRWVNIEAAERMSLTAKKPILYDFSAEWCGPCRVMEEEIFRDSDMATYINQHFIPVKVVDRMREDHGNPPEVEKLQSRFGVTAFPTVIVVQREREPRKVLGYPGREQFVQFLRGIR